MSQNYENYDNSLYEVDMDCIKEQKEVKEMSQDFYKDMGLQQMGFEGRERRGGNERREHMRECGCEPVREERESRGREGGCRESVREEICMDSRREGQREVSQRNSCRDERREHEDKRCRRQEENERRNSCQRETPCKKSNHQAQCGSNLILLLLILCCCN